MKYLMTDEMTLAVFSNEVTKPLDAPTDFRRSVNVGTDDEPVMIGAALDYDVHVNNGSMKVVPVFDRFDKGVYEVIVSRYVHGHKSISISDIYEHLGYKPLPASTRKHVYGRILEAIEKFWGELCTNTEVQTQKGTKEFREGESLLSFSLITQTTKNEELVDGHIELFAEPVLWKWALLLDPSKTGNERRETIRNYYLEKDKWLRKQLAKSRRPTEFVFLDYETLGLPQ